MHQAWTRGRNVFGVVTPELVRQRREPEEFREGLRDLLKEQSSALVHNMLKGHHVETRQARRLREQAEAAKRLTGNRDEEARMNSISSETNFTDTFHKLFQGARGASPPLGDDGGGGEVGEEPTTRKGKAQGDSAETPTSRANSSRGLSRPGSSSGNRMGAKAKSRPGSGGKSGRSNRPKSNKGNRPGSSGKKRGKPRSRR